MSSAAEAEVISLYLNAKEAVLLRQCLHDLGHPQPPTPMITDNSTARGIIRGTMKQRQAKAFDMRTNWIRNRSDLQQFNIIWQPGKHDLADYPTKIHSGKHHRLLRPIYLYNHKTSPRTMKGCIRILEDAHPKPVTLPKSVTKSAVTLPKSVTPRAHTAVTRPCVTQGSHVLPHARTLPRSSTQRSHLTSRPHNQSSRSCFLTPLLKKYTAALTLTYTGISR